MTGTVSHLAGLWPLSGLLIETPRLQLRLPTDDELPALTEAARDIAGPDGPRLQMPWMYGESPDMERHLLQRHWRALAHWKPGSWHLPLAAFLAAEPLGMLVKDHELAVALHHIVSLKVWHRGLAPDLTQVPSMHQFP